jgi:hypothetical protein
LEQKKISSVKVCGGIEETGSVMLSRLNMQEGSSDFLPVKVLSLGDTGTLFPFSPFYGHVQNASFLAVLVIN